MLDNLRRLGRTWIGKVIGAFLLVGLAGFGISNVLLDFGSNNVASVGDADIRARDFQRAYNDDLNRIAQQLGRVPEPQDAVAMGIPSSTLGRLATEAAINQFGQQLGVGVSDTRLSRMLREDPTFAGTLGTFDPDSFKVVLQRSGYTESEYFDTQARAARRQQIVAGLFADATVPDAAKELLNRFTGDTRTIDYFVMNEFSAPEVAEATEEEIVAYLAENQAQFRTPERRTTDILVLSLDSLAATQEVTDAEIAAEYERTRDSRARAERRTIVQAPLTTVDAQALFEDGRVAGRSFEELVAEAGVQTTELGNLTLAQVTDAALAEAAFALEPGTFTIIPGIGGKRAVTVTSIEEGGVPTLDEVRDDIRRSVALAKAREQYLDVLDQIEELRAAFQPLADIAGRLGLPVHEVTLSRTGSELSDVAGLGEENRARVTGAVFAAEQGNLTPTVAISANNNVWFDLKSIEPARDQTLDEVRGPVTLALIQQRTDKALAGAVDDVVTRIEAGEALEDVAASVNQVAQVSPALNRQGDGTAVLNQAVAGAAFGGGPGHVGSARNGDGDYVVFRVADITAAAETSAEAEAYLEESAQQSLFAAFVGGLRDAAGVRVNQQTLNQLLALDSTGR